MEKNLKISHKVNAIVNPSDDFIQKKKKNVFCIILKQFYFQLKFWLNSSVVLHLRVQRIIPVLKEKNKNFGWRENNAKKKKVNLLNQNYFIRLKNVFIE